MTTLTRSVWRRLQKCYKAVSFFLQLLTFSKALRNLSILVLVEVGQSARSFCELSGRTIPVIGDVIVALVNMGISLQGIEAFAKRDGRQIIPMPSQASQQKQLNLLQAGTKSSHPPHMPNYLPSLPDPHAYVRTPVINK